MFHGLDRPHDRIKLSVLEFSRTAKDIGAFERYLLEFAHKIEWIGLDTCLRGRFSSRRLYKVDLQQTTPRAAETGFDGELRHGDGTRKRP